MILMAIAIHFTFSINIRSELLSNTGNVINTATKIPKERRLGSFDDELQTGSLYVHLDSGMSHPVKLLLDEVFGPEAFRNEIIWKRANAHNDPKKFGRISSQVAGSAIAFFCGNSSLDGAGPV